MKFYLFFSILFVMIIFLTLSCSVDHSNPTAPSGPTQTPTLTNTSTPTATLIITPTFSNTPTFTITMTASLTPTDSSTETSTNTPTYTSTFTETGTTTNTPTSTATPSIFWYSGYAWRITSDSNPSTTSTNLHLQVNGLPDATANVFLTGTNISTPVTLPFNSVITIAGPGSVVAWYSLNGGWAYQVGDSYTLTCIAAGVTTAATLLAPGNISVLTDTSGAVTEANWTTEGNHDLVEIYLMPLSSLVFSLPPDLDSPVSIDSVTPYATPGNYNEMISVENFTTNVSNAAVTSAFSVGDVVERNFTK